ncbi:MAG: cardiolipin synthase [Planctomycetaceae bacterium]|nr:cardiolipin synthase [Planctomycetaceae bacterium]
MTWYLVYNISEWLIRLVMLPVVTYRRKPSAAMSWLLLIFFLPWFGLVLYLLFGTRRLPLVRRRRIAEISQKLEAEARRFHGDPNIVHPDLGPRLASTIQIAEQLGNFPILGGNNAVFLADTDLVIDQMIDDMDRAQHHIHMLFYIFWDDETGDRVIDALGRAVRRGVACRVLVDDVGSRKPYRTLAAKMQACGVSLHTTLPVGLFRSKMTRIDMRNHRKLTVIDGRIAYTGSQNIVNASYGHKDMAWHDMMVRLTGPITLELQAIFVTDWHQETHEVLTGPAIFVPPVPAGSVPAQTLPSGPTFPVENYQRLVVSAIYDALRRVIITTPYFVPDEPLLQAIQAAAWRGVQVDLIVPQRCDQIIVGAAARAYYEDVLEAGANVYLHTQGLLHSKTMTVDESLALIGSSNFDIRSFAINFELNMLLYGADVTCALRDQQLRYLRDSIKLDAREWRQRPSWRVLLDNMARLMSPLL